jgi:hypothetical protein
MVNGIEHDLARMALKDTLTLITPAKVLIWTNSVREYHDLKGITQLREDITGIDKVQEIMWRHVPKAVTTSHMLFIQWDGWVVDPSMWDDSFLAYDYIGAPWPWRAEGQTQVGNGGFSLRSTKLMLELRDARLDDAEDALLCDKYGPQLRVMGYKFAPKAVASRFSIECEIDIRPTFGFHGVENFKRMLTPSELSARVQAAGKYAMSKHKWLADKEISLA